MKRLLPLLLWPVLLFGQGTQIQQTTVANLPSPPKHANTVFMVTDGTSASDCTVGGGSTVVFCAWNGSAWGLTAGTAATANALASTPPACSAGNVLQGITTTGAGNPCVPVVVPTQTNNFTAAQNFQADISCFKGPNPYVDIRCFGARAVNPNTTPAIPGITASCTSGQPTVTISSASTFQNGDGVIIYGCGAAHAMATPSAPTVTPSLSRTMTGTRDAINSPTGSTTYNYCVAWRDLLGGMTACSPTGTTTTGLASLGSLSVALTSLSRANDVVTAVTSVAHGLPVGCTGAASGATACPTVFIQPTTAAFADASWLGWHRLLTVADTTHFTYQDDQDTRNGALTTTSAGFTGNVFYYESNHVSFGAAPTGGFQPYIFAAGGALIGPAWATNPSNGGFTDTQFDDFGGTMMGTTNIAAPGYVPTTAPASATNDALITTIVSGAGTTTLTLAANAGNTISGQTILLDNAPNIKAAVTASYSGIAGPPILFPVDPSGNTFVINSLLDLRTNSPTLVINNTTQFNDTVLLGSGSVSGRVLPSKGSAGSFSFGSYSRITCRANPCLYVTATNTTGYMDWLSVGSTTNGAQQALLVMQDGGSAKGPPNYTNMDLGITGLTSMDLLIRGVTGGGTAIHGDRLSIAGVQNAEGATATPVFLATGLNQSNPVGSIKFGSIFLNGQGMMTVGGQVQNDWLYCQGCRMPLWTVTWENAGNSSSQFKIGVATHDTAAHALLSYLPGIGALTTAVEVFTDNGPSSSVPTFTGSKISLVRSNSGIGNTPGQNVGTQFSTTPTTADGVFNINGFTNITPQLSMTETFRVGSSHAIFIDGGPPTNMACVVQAGGSLTVATHTFQIAPVWAGNTVGKISASASCTTSSGNQQVQVTWTPPAGNPIGYVTVMDSLVQRGSTCAFPQITPGSLGSFTWSSNINCGSYGQGANDSAGGPTMLLPGVQGIAAPLVQAPNLVSNGGACTNAELALSAGWQSTGSATVTAVAGLNQTCSWTITTGTTTAANPTVTDTLQNALPNATIVCEMNIHGGTHTAAAGEGFQQTTLSATAPIFTFNGTPTAGGTTYFITRRCGP